MRLDYSAICDQSNVAKQFQSVTMSQRRLTMFRMGFWRSGNDFQDRRRQKIYIATAEVGSFSSNKFSNVRLLPHLPFSTDSQISRLHYRITKSFYTIAGDNSFFDFI